MIPASSSSASVDWRCEVDGGWTTIVWTLPSEAVSSGSRSASMTARPASRPPATSKASIPPDDARPELADRDVVLRMAGEARVEDRAHAVLTLEPGGQCRGRPGVALGAHGEGQDPAQDEERLERAEGRAGIDLDPLDVRDPLGRTGDDAGDDVAVAAQELGRRIRRRGPRRGRAGGRCTGEANVLSTRYVAPCRWASSASVA